VTRTITTSRPRSRIAREAREAPSLTRAREEVWGIIGNAPVVKRLQRMVTAGPDAHAVLLSGTSGIGKAALATSLAQAFVCSNHTKENACGACRNCVSFSHRRHPDLLSIIDGDGVIDIELMRGITASLQRRPTLSTRHVVLIDRIERMTEEASNAFLKTLEEPYGDTMFVLTTNSIHLVPHTIISRCSLFHCTQMPEDEIRKRLVAAGIAATEARRIAAIADGRPAYALRLARQRGAYDQALEDAGSLLALIRAVPHERIRIAETIASHKEEPARMVAVLDRWESTVRRMLRIAAGLPDHGPGVEAIRSLVATTMTIPAIVRLAQQLRTMRDRIRTSGNIRLNIESFSLHLPTTRP